MTERLVLVTRGDLMPGYQLVQSTHAAIQFLMRYPAVSRRWYKNSQNLAALVIPNELALVDLYKRAEEMGLKCVLFKEPDIGNEATAVAIEPDERTYKLTSQLPLALKNYEEVRPTQKSQNQ